MAEKEATASRGLGNRFFAWFFKTARVSPSAFHASTTIALSVLQKISVVVGPGKKKVSRKSVSAGVPRISSRVERGGLSAEERNLGCLLPKLQLEKKERVPFFGNEPTYIFSIQFSQGVSNAVKILLDISEILV